MKKIELDVGGMHCRSCEMLIEDSLGDQPGVMKVSVSHEKGKVMVEFDEKKIDKAKIAQVIKDEGYEVG